MRLDSAAQILIDTLEGVEDFSLNPEEVYPLEVAISESLRVLNVNGSDVIDIIQAAWGIHTFDVLAEVANDERVKVETELYALVNDLFYAVRAGNADLSAFFYAILGKNL
jgi:hypothetical protein